MKPYLSPYDVADGGLAYAEHRSKAPAVVRAIGVEPAYFPDIGFSQDRVAVLLSSERVGRPGGATFTHHICRVVGWCSDEEVIRSHASRVVALVADEQSSRDWAAVQLPREAVGGDVPSGDHQGAVAFVVCGLEVPALAGFLDVTPEPLLSGPPSSKIAAWRAAVSTSSSQEDVGRYPESGMADFAGALDAADVALVHPDTIPHGWISRTDLTDVVTV